MAFLVPVNHNGGRNIYELGAATSVPARSRHFPVADDFRGVTARAGFGWLARISEWISRPTERLPTDLVFPTGHQ